MRIFTKNKSTKYKHYDNIFHLPNETREQRGAII
jgi:hypothetical protein